MSRPRPRADALWLLVAGVALLVSVIAMTWHESHLPWQAWQARYTPTSGTPPPSGVQALVPTRTGKPELCVTCHVGIEDISPSHPAQTFGCVVCHGGEPLALDADRAHAGMRGGRNPADLSVAAVSCGQPDCHGGYADPERNHVDRVLKSLQATYAGGIAAVRYTFGLQPDATARFGVRAVQDASTPLPLATVASLREFSGSAGNTQAPLERNFAQTCLTGGCHLWAAPEPQAYSYRGTGCTACHYLYDASGVYRGRDPTISRDEPGHGAFHRLTTAIPYSQCNHCHNRGTYSLKQMTFLPREDLPPQGAPLPATMPPEGRRLIEYYQPISQFTKCEYELDCVDCHTSQEAMGTGHIYGSKKDAEYVRCETCHGTPTRAPQTAVIGAADDLAMRQARLNGHADFLAVGDRAIQTERGDLLWSVKQQADGKFVQLAKVSGTLYPVPLVKGSKCTQNGADQSSAYCHECHEAAR